MPFAPRPLTAAFICLFTGLFCVGAASQTYPVTHADSSGTQRAGFDERALAIALAREKALEILRGENSCSAWFRQADPDAAGVFTSLRFVIDRNGRPFITATRTRFGEVLLIHPYAASTLESSGRHAVVTLNANGPFFVRAAPLLPQNVVGLHSFGWRRLQVDSYLGDTLEAQITTLLHELGHVVGRLPEDANDLSGQSVRNTAEVLHFCRGQIGSAAHDHHIAVIRAGD